MKDVQATGESYSPQKRTYSTSIKSLKLILADQCQCGMRILIHSSGWLLNNDVKGYTRVNNSVPVWGGFDRPHTRPPGCSSDQGLPQISQNVLHQNSRFLKKNYGRFAFMPGKESHKKISSLEAVDLFPINPDYLLFGCYLLHRGVKNLRPFDLRLTLGVPPLCSDITIIVIKVAGSYWVVGKSDAIIALL